MTGVVLFADQGMIGWVGGELIVRGITVVAEANDGRAALDAVRRYRPDVVLMDIRMPVLDGIAATEADHRRRPWPTKVLVVTTYDLDELVYRALRGGAASSVLKSTPADRLAAGVELVAAGETLLSPTLTRRLIEQFIKRPAPGKPDALLNRLTEREHEVLRLVAQGLSNTDRRKSRGVIDDREDACQQDLREAQP